MQSIGLLSKIALIDWLFCISTITSDPLHAILMDLMRSFNLPLQLASVFLDAKNYNSQDYPPQLFPLFANS